MSVSDVRNDGMSRLVKQYQAKITFLSRESHLKLRRRIGQMITI